MKNGLIFAALPIMLLGACSEADPATPLEAEPEVDLAAGTGAYMVTIPDGTRILSFATADGVQYSGAMTTDPGRWSIEGEQACVDPAGDEEPVCWTSSPVGADGTFTNTMADGTVTGAITSLLPAEEGQAGAWLVANEDGSTSLAVWTADGDAYFAPETETGTWRAVDGQRCGKIGDETEESCGTPGEMGEDGTFTATNADGSTITVQMLQ